MIASESGIAPASSSTASNGSEVAAGMLSGTSPWPLLLASRRNASPVPAANPNARAPNPSTSVRGGQLRPGGISAGEMTRTFRVSSRSCSPVSCERTRKA